MRICWSLKQMMLTGLGCLLIGAGGLMLLYQQGVLGGQTGSVNLEKTMDLSNIDNLSITTDIPDLTLTHSSSGELRIYLNGHLSEADAAHAGIVLTPKESGGSVEAVIRTGRPFQLGIDVDKLFSGFQRDLKVVVELPDKAYRSLELRTDTGNMTLPALRADTLHLASDTGDITLAGFTGTRLAAETDTGTLRLCRVSAEAKLASDTGDVYLDLTGLPGNIDVSTDTGDMWLTLARPSSLEADFATDTGEATISGDAAGLQYGSKEKHKLRGSLGTGGPLVKARTDTGDIQLMLQ